jgi:hypothetical protein
VTVIVVPWPRVPTVTPGGKPSKAKNAGRLIPWLSANVVNNLPKPVYRRHVTAWRLASQDVVYDGWGTHYWELPGDPCEVVVRLYKRTGQGMDAAAVVEGVKPLLDGLEASGLLLDDALVVGFPRATAFKAGKGEERVELELRAVER